MLVRTLWRLAALSLVLSASLGAGLAFAQQHVGEVVPGPYVPAGGICAGLDPSGDPDGVQGNPASSFSKPSGASCSVAPVVDPTEQKAGWGAAWAHWFAGLLQRIGFRY